MKDTINMKNIIDARDRFLKHDDGWGDEIIYMTHKAYWESIELTLQGTLITVLDEGDDAWMQFGEEIRRLHAETIRD
jgi:hypothetical protein